MMDSDTRRYYLPDGTMVLASFMTNGGQLLEAEDGTPLYRTEGKHLLRLEYDAAEDAYRAVPTDLTVADLLLVD